MYLSVHAKETPVYVHGVSCDRAESTTNQSPTNHQPAFLRSSESLIRRNHLNAVQLLRVKKRVNWTGSGAAEAANQRYASESRAPKCDQSLGSVGLWKNWGAGQDRLDFLDGLEIGGFSLTVTTDRLCSPDILVILHVVLICFDIYIYIKHENPWKTLSCQTLPVPFNVDVEKKNMLKNNVYVK